MTAPKADLSFAEPPPFPIRRFTVEEYRGLAEADFLIEEDRVELLEGWIVEKKVTHNPPHDGTIALSQEAIRTRLPPGWHIRVQSSITTGDSEPEPDLVVVRGPLGQYLAAHPGPEDIAFVVEVAGSSLGWDRRVKGRVYARARIAVYWIVNLVERQIEVYTEPSDRSERAEAPAHPHFRSRTDYRHGDEIPLVIEGREVARIPVRELIGGT